MNKTINILKWISVIGGAIAGLFGAWDDALTYLLVLNAVDFASGLVCAFRGKSHKTESGGVASDVVFDGVARKAFMWLIVLLAAALDRSIGDGSSMSFRTAAAFFYIANEALSILENAALLDLPVPEFIRKTLEVLLEKSDSGENMKGTTVSGASTDVQEMPISGGVVEALARTGETHPREREPETEASNDDDDESDEDGDPH